MICGHIHHAVIHRRSDLLYINCGDWVESCTAVVEHFDGVFEIVKWEATGTRLDEPDHVEAASPAPLRPAAGGLNAAFDVLKRLAAGA